MSRTNDRHQNLYLAASALAGDDPIIAEDLRQALVLDQKWCDALDALFQADAKRAAHAASQAELDAAMREEQQRVDISRDADLELAETLYERRGIVVAGWESEIRASFGIDPPPKAKP